MAEISRIPANSDKSSTKLALRWMVEELWSWLYRANPTSMVGRLYDLEAGPCTESGTPIIRNARPEAVGPASPCGSLC